MRVHSESVRFAAVCVLALWAAVACGGQDGVASDDDPPSASRGRFTARVDVDQFQRGNLHTHSTSSDGSEPIEDMVAWYREHDYRFLAMTEHNLRVDPRDLAPLEDARFVLIPGEEVTNRWQGQPLHVNSLCARVTIGGWIDFPAADVAIARVFAMIRAAGGVPLLNHPNFRWALDVYDIARGATGPYLLEIWSGHPIVHALGDDDHPSEESIWDGLVARGENPTPVAVDDAHSLVEAKGDEAVPGRGWVETFGGETSREAICASLAAGQLYASSGPRLSRILVDDDVFAVAVDDVRATVAFLGEEGEPLAVLRSPEPSRDLRPGLFVYTLRGGETAVRARISVDGGGIAWTPAYRVASDPPSPSSDEAR